MVETDPPASPIPEPGEDRLERLEAMLDTVLGRLSAHTMAISLLLKALAAINRDSGAAVAMALEVAEIDLLDLEGDTETIRVLRHIREQLANAPPPDGD